MIRQAEPGDAMTLAELAVKLWKGHSVRELSDMFEALISGGNAACFLQYVGGKAIGFAQCQLRHEYVEGTGSSPVGYLEGIFVEDVYRRHGYARELLGACEAWSKEKHCTEFASDCELENDDSLRFHMAMGFEEANRMGIILRWVFPPTNGAPNGSPPAEKQIRRDFRPNTSNETFPFGER